MKLTWSEYKSRAADELEADGAYIYRGQSNADWKLTTTLHRTTIVRTAEELQGYSNHIVPQVHEAIESWLGRSWNLGDPRGLAEFLSFLQHNGFPTPLLDWTYSPYIAAYFAFESVNHFDPQTDEVAIYSFNQREWVRKYDQIYDFGDFSPHVSVLVPRQLGNHKLAVQQGCFTWSNVKDIEEHINLNDQDQKFLLKYVLDVNERPMPVRFRLRAPQNNPAKLEWVGNPPQLAFVHRADIGTAQRERFDGYFVGLIFDEIAL